VMVAVLAVVGGLEFYALTKGRPNQGIAWVGIPMILAVLLAYYSGAWILWILAVFFGIFAAFLAAILRTNDMTRVLRQVAMTLAGVVYVGFPMAFLIAIRRLDDGFAWLLVVCMTTWATDTFAYFGGTLWGKHKLAPRISPKKTVEGAVIGVIGGFFVAVFVLIFGGVFSLGAVFMLMVAPFVAVAGDLLESALKRRYDVKDSHIAGLDVIPGHGGVLDRVDSLMLVGVFCYFFILLTGIAG